MIKTFLKKLNIIDYLLIGLVILSLIALLYKIFLGNIGSGDSLVFTYICDSAPITLAEAIVQDDRCIDGDTGEDLGTVTHVKYEPSADTDGKCRAEITAAADGIKSAHGVQIGRTVYLKGKKINLIIGDSVFEVYISDIS